MMPNIQLAADAITITPFGGTPFTVPGPVSYNEEHDTFYAGGASYPAEIVRIEKAPDGAVTHSQARKNITEFILND